MKVIIDQIEYFAEDDAMVCEVLGFGSFESGGVKKALLELSSLPSSDYGRIKLKQGMKIKISILKDEQ